MEAINQIKLVVESAQKRSRYNEMHLEVGQWTRQGDVYIHCIESREQFYKTILPGGEEFLPKSRRGELSQDRQLAPGNTKGSRHILGRCDVTIYAPHKDAGVLEGPELHTDQLIVNHPEHAAKKITSDTGKYIVTYQLDQKTRQRVRD